MVTGRRMETPIALVHRGFELRPVADVAFDRLELRARQAAQIRAGPDERFDAVPARNEFMHQIGSNESRCASDEAVHKVLFSRQIRIAFPA
jgi:hypothetical protein